MSDEDLVRRLRVQAGSRSGTADVMSDGSIVWHPLMIDAAHAIERLTRERDEQKETAEYLLKLEQEWIDYNNQLAEDWKKEHARAETAERKVEVLRDALLTAEMMLSELRISSAEKCQLAYDHLNAARAALAETEECK